MSASLDDVGAVPGGCTIRQFLEVAHNDDGTLRSSPFQPAPKLPDPPTIPGANALALSSMFAGLSSDLFLIWDSTVGADPAAKAFMPGTSYNSAVWTRDQAHTISQVPALLSSIQRRNFVNEWCRKISANVVPSRIDTLATAYYANAPYTQELDNPGHLVMALYADFKATGDNTTFLANEPALAAALTALPKDANGCVYNDPAAWQPSWPCDYVMKTGAMAGATALLAFAYRLMAEMKGEGSPAQGGAGGTYTTATNAAINGLRTLRKESGWYMPSSISEASRDGVFETAFIVAEGLCNEAEQIASATTIVDAYITGTITQRGWVRNLPVGQYWNGDNTVGTQPPGTADTYQNGGFWALPLQRCLRAAALVAPDVAFRWGQEAVAEWNRQKAAEGTVVGAIWVSGVQESSGYSMAIGSAGYEWISADATRIGSPAYAWTLAQFARLASPVTALRTLSLVSAGLSDEFQADSSANYNLSNFAYDATDKCMKGTADQAYFEHKTYSKQDCGVTLNWSSNLTSGVYFAIYLRFQDANNYLALRGTGSGLSLIERVSGVSTTIATLSVTGFVVPTNNTTYTASAWVVGNQLYGYAFGRLLNGTVTTLLSAGGVAGAQRGGASNQNISVFSINAYDLSGLGMIPADVVVADGNGVYLPSASLERLMVGTEVRVLDSQGRVVASKSLTYPAPITLV